jgi:hypothetical protein
MSDLRSKYASLLFFLRNATSTGVMVVGICALQMLSYDGSWALVAVSAVVSHCMRMRNFDGMHTWPLQLCTKQTDRN